MPPAAVDVVTLKSAPLQLTTELTGRTAARRIAEVRPQVSGIILKRHFEEGSEVKAGQVLYQLEPVRGLEAVKEASLQVGGLTVNVAVISLSLTTAKVSMRPLTCGLARLVATHTT